MRPEKPFKVGEAVVASEDIICCCEDKDCPKPSVKKGTMGKVVKTFHCSVHGWTIEVEFGQTKADLVVLPKSIGHLAN